jgi:hypothetical protein
MEGEATIEEIWPHEHPIIWIVPTQKGERLKENTTYHGNQVAL